MVRPSSRPCPAGCWVGIFDRLVTMMLPPRQIYGMVSSCFPLTIPKSQPMQIWVDADACPVVVREILCRAAERSQTKLTFVANQAVKVPPSKFIKSVVVAHGFDVADHFIAAQAGQDDLVVTQDIPLAYEVIEKGAQAVSPRGEAWTPANIKARLQMRDFMETLRSSGVHTGGPPPLSQADRQQFANVLDKWLLQRSRAMPKDVG